MVCLGPLCHPQTDGLYLLEEYGVSTTFNISDLIPFAGEADIEEEEPTDLRSNPLQGEGMMQSSLERDQSPDS